MSEEKKGWLARLRAGLSRTSSRLSDGIGGIFSGRKLDDTALEELEDLVLGFLNAGLSAVVSDEGDSLDGSFWAELRLLFVGLTGNGGNEGEGSEFHSLF